MIPLLKECLHGGVEDVIEIYFYSSILLTIYWVLFSSRINNRYKMASATYSLPPLPYAYNVSLLIF